MDDLTDSQGAQAPEMSDLDRIAIAAQARENEQEAVEQAILNPEAANAPDPALAWAQIPKMFGSLLGMALPELQHVYTDANCAQWGGAMAQVADKYGWDAGETMAKWAPEIALVVATLPLAVPTFQVIKAARKKAEAEKPKPAPVQNDIVSEKCRSTKRPACQSEAILSNRNKGKGTANDAQIVAVIGASGMGKSSYIKGDLLRSYDRLLIWSPLEETDKYAGFCKGVVIRGKITALITAVKANTKAIVYVPTGSSSDVKNSSMTFAPLLGRWKAQPCLLRNSVR